MNGSSIKPVPAKVETTAPSSTRPPAITNSESTRPQTAAPAADAISVSVSRTQSRGLAANDPTEAVDALVKGIEGNASLAAAHGRLDAARVFGLLNDDEEDSEL